MNSPLAAKQKTNRNKPELKVVKQKPRTLDDLLTEGRNKPNPFRQWSLMVEEQVDKEMGKPGVPKDRGEARNHVLAQERSYWM